MEEDFCTRTTASEGKVENKVTKLKNFPLIQLLPLNDGKQQSFNLFTISREGKNTRRTRLEIFSVSDSLF